MGVQGKAQGKARRPRDPRIDRGLSPLALLCSLGLSGASPSLSLDPPDPLPRDYRGP